jgi:hypothetical protein
VGLALNLLQACNEANAGNFVLGKSMLRGRSKKY